MFRDDAMITSSDSEDLSDSNEARTIKEQKNKKIRFSSIMPGTSSASMDDNMIMEVNYEESESDEQEQEGLQSSSKQVITTKQTSRVQRFSQKWLSDPKLQEWIQVAEHSNLYAKCNACVIYLKAKYTDLVNHTNSERHKNLVKKIKGSNKVDVMLKQLKHNKNQETIDVVSAHLRSSLLVVEHNLSFNVIDHITKVNKINFKDSKIAESLQLGRTKCTMIIQNVLGKVLSNELKEQIKDKKVSVLLDEATDISNKKLLCILVKFISDNEIKTQVLGLKEVDSDHGKAKGLYELLKQSLNEFEIKQNNVIGYCADNASVMMGSKESVKQYLLNSNPNLISNGCICHSIHLVAVAAAACLPQRLENFLQNISTYFSRSPKRQSVLQTFQEFIGTEKLKILKPSKTRWLALSKCVDRIIEMWNVLTELFRLADFEHESEVATIIYNELCNPVTKAYMLFLQYVLPIFNRFNAFFQSEKLLTPLIYAECVRFLKLLGSNFLKAEYLSDDITNLNCTHSHCFIPLEAIHIGSSTSDLIASFDKKLKDHFLLNCLEFYQKAFQECLNRFPLNNFFKNLNFILIENAVNPTIISDIKCVATKLSPTTIDSCMTEYKQLKIYFSKEELSNLPKEPIAFWKYLGTLRNFNDEYIFKNISELALIILCIPHGNADVERIFSNITDIKTKKRNKLSTSMLKAVLRIKVDLHCKKTCCYNYTFSREHFEKYNVEMYSFKK